MADNNYSCAARSSHILVDRVVVPINLILICRRGQVGLLMFNLDIVYLQICQPLVMLLVSCEPLPSKQLQQLSF